MAPMGGWRDFVSRVLEGEPDAVRDFSSSAFRVSQALNDPFAQEVTARLAKWLLRVQERATHKWHQLDFRCDVVVGRDQCRNRAEGRCIVCGRNTCLSHALLSADADVMCGHCFVFARQHAPKFTGPAERPWSPDSGPRRGQAPPAPNQDAEAALEEAYELLGVSKDVSQEDLDRRVRDLRVKNHPDRFKTDKAKANAEERFKKIGLAYDLITKAREKKA